ncbi:MAG: hypothetical protein IJ764_05950 [Bacteroidales bacterium]|nr:hypothetical protein [Bacteroidales bacterium]
MASPTKKAFVLRIEGQMLEAIERWAADEFRSTNGQIEYLLSEALRKARRLPRKETARTNQTPTMNNATKND